MIAQETIAEVLERASLVELVSAAVTLKRRANRHVGLCPFHNEKTPSFTIRDDEFFYCFGCGASGNAIAYVMRSKGLSFVEAVEDLAAQLGIQVKRTGGRARTAGGVDSRVLFQVNELAAKLFRDELSKSKEAVEYLRERGVTREAVQAFAIGFAGSGRSTLLEALQHKEMPESALLSAGLIKRSESGRVYDTFRTRIIFPVFIDERRIAGFGGRSIPKLVEQGMTPPKYLNSPETPIYEKSKLFFGLPQALRSIRENGEVYIVEGYLDVIGMWQAGVRGTVATCGTAVTDKHAARLKHLARRVLFLFDGDAAGRGAAAKAFPVFLNSGLDTLAVFLPEGKDPDDFAAANGPGTAGALRSLPTRSLFDCYLESKLETFSGGGASELGAASKGQLCEELAHVLRRVDNSVERSEMVQRASMKLMIEPAAFERLLGEGKPPKPAEVRAEPEVSTIEVQNPEELPGLDQDVLRAAINYKADSAAAVLAEAQLIQVLKGTTVEFLQELAELFALPEEAAQRERVKTLLSAYGPAWTRFWKEARLIGSSLQADLTALLYDWRKAAQRSRIAEEMSALKNELNQAQSDDEKLELAARILDLGRALREKAG